LAGVIADEITAVFEAGRWDTLFGRSTPAA
jgi:hypothetical protein